MHHITNNQQVKLCDLPQLKNRRIKGYYRLIGLLAQLDQRGRPSWQLQLSDDTGGLLAELKKMDVSMPEGEDSIRLKNGVMPEKIRIGGMVQLEAKICYDGIYPKATIVRIEPA